MGFKLYKNSTQTTTGKISASDTAWGSLKVWRDADGDAFTDAGELVTLDSLGIRTVNIQNVMPGLGVDGNNNDHRQTSSFERTNNSTGGRHRRLVQREFEFNSRYHGSTITGEC